MTVEKGSFKKIGEEIGALVQEKNKNYGNSFGKVADFLTILWPNGIPVEAYTDALCTVRMFDKLMRVANNKNAYGESPYRDIAGYAILGVEKDEGVVTLEETTATKPTTNTVSYRGIQVPVDDVKDEAAVLEENKELLRRTLKETYETVTSTTSTQYFNKEALNNILSNPDESLLRNAAIQEINPAVNHFASDGKFLGKTLDSDKLQELKELDDWLSENLVHPDKLEVEVWKISSVMWLKPDDEIRFTAIYTAVQSAPRHGIVVDYNKEKDVLTVNVIDPVTKKTSLLFYERDQINHLRVKRTLKFSSKEELSNWYQIRDTSDISVDAAITKLSDKMILMNEENAKLVMENLKHKPSKEITVIDDGTV